MLRGLCLVLVIYFIHITTVVGQTYGLEFNGYQVTLDKRTELNLTPDKFHRFKNEFEISFAFKAIQTVPNSYAGLFGYVFRIIDSEGKNFDLVSTPAPQLNLVLGNSNKVIPFSYADEMINNWMNLSIKFLLSEDKLIFVTPDSTYMMENLGFDKSESFKIIFGANDYSQFKSSDVPSMALKDIHIFENEKLKYYWPLNEKSGDVAIDNIRGAKAKVINPKWLVLPHQNWQKCFEDEISGAVRITADSENGKIFLTGKEKITVFSTQNNSESEIEYQNTPSFYDVNYRTEFNTSDNKIYCYMADELPFYSLGINSGIWNKSGMPVDFQTKYRHHNSFYRKQDNSIYSFGGYGGHKYKNNIFKIDLSDSLISQLPSDSVFQPRYLAGSYALNDTLYILGGYGSATGDQLINPRSYFNLLAYSFETGKMVEKFKIPNLLDDMVVGNKIWIDEKTRDYYALIFSKVKFENQLQLIKGNIDSPEVELVGNKIPFKFLDVRSFVNLYYMPVQNKLYTTISYLNDSNSQVSVYSINYPPNIIETDAKLPKKRSWLLIILVLAVLIAIAGLIFIIKKRNKGDAINKLVKEKIIKRSDAKSYNTLIQKNYNLIFFGGFQVFDKNSVDITNKFSPLLKELFLLILFYTHKNNKGISSAKLAEILWRDKSERSARNNRAVNIAKLKGILSEIGECELSKKTGYWKIGFSETEVKSDYLEFLHITSSQKHLTKENIIHLIEITEKGAFLFNVDYEWLDNFKAMVSDKIVDTLIGFGQSIDVKDDADFIIHLADSVFNFDIVNEEAMILKCKAQHCMGKHSLAKSTYEKFYKEYNTMYGQKYDKGFLDILS